MTIPEVEAPPLLSAAAPKKTAASWRHRVARLLWFLPKFSMGVLLCQSFIGSLVVVGWTYRLTQRAALKYWWKRSGLRQHGGTFAEFLKENDRSCQLVYWPNWILAQNFRQSVRRKNTGLRTLWHFIEATSRSLRINFWLGVQGAFTTCLFTLPPCLLWWFGWFDGWNNSFGKGYEQAVVGPLISWIGIFAFIAVMFYVPMAQARQAATADWRTFFDFRLVWEVTRKRWMWCVALAFCYALAALPVAILKTAPLFIPNGQAAMESWNSKQALEYLNNYFLFCAVFVFPMYALLRVLAGRIYAGGLLAAVKSARVRMLDLGETERETLWRLDLLQAQPRQQRHFVLRFLAWAGTRTGRFAGGFAIAALWFVFVSLNYIAEFLNYHPGLGWINQSLIQAPWFRYIPPSIQNPMLEIGLGLLVIGSAFVIGALYRRIRAVCGR